MRRLFRSTACHNSVVVDGEEQIPIYNSMFGLINPSGIVRILSWETDENSDLLEAEHTGYSRLKSPVVHRRRFFLDKLNQKIKIADMFLGKGEHSLEWYLHLDMGLKCTIQGGFAVILRSNDTLLKIVCKGFEANLEVKTGWISTAYNRRNDTKILYWNHSGEIKPSLMFTQELSLL